MQEDVLGSGWKADILIGTRRDNAEIYVVGSAKALSTLVFGGDRGGG